MYTPQFLRLKQAEVLWVKDQSKVYSKTMSQNRLPPPMYSYPASMVSTCGQNSFRSPHKIDPLLSLGFHNQITAFINDCYHTSRCWKPFPKVEVIKVQRSWEDPLLNILALSASECVLYLLLTQYSVVLIVWNTASPGKMQMLTWESGWLET